MLRIPRPYNSMETTPGYKDGNHLRGGGQDIHWSCKMADLSRELGTFTFRKSMVDQIGTRMLKNRHFQLDTFLLVVRC